MHEHPQRQNDLNAILIKPIGAACNLSCTYCFYRETGNLWTHSGTTRMTDEVLDAMTRQMMALPSRHISLGWQGGEPTLMGLAFFERAIEFQKRYGRGKIVGNSLQTNGRLIDAAWARFLFQYNFLVGLSIDGPAEIHDRYRGQGDGGSWTAAVDAAKRLQDKGVSVNSLTVVNDVTVKHPLEIYTTLKTLGFTHQQYIPCAEPAPAFSSQQAPFSVTSEDYGAFLVDLFDLWWDDFENGLPTTMVRLFDALLAKFLDEPVSDCTLLETCGVYLVVEHNGDVFPCDFFVSADTRLGNIMEAPLQSLFQTQQRKAFATAKSHLPARCTACDWLSLCRGGCPKERPVVDGVAAASRYCGAYQQLFEHAVPRLQKTAERIETLEQQARRAEVRAAIERSGRQVGRNEPCPCGSGRKFKRCCGP